MQLIWILRCICIYEPPSDGARVSHGQVDVNPVDQQVEMWLRSKAELSLPSVSITEGERLLVEVSRKFTAQRLASLAYKSGLCIQVCTISRTAPIAGL